MKKLAVILAAIIAMISCNEPKKVIVTAITSITLEEPTSEIIVGSTCQMIVKTSPEVNGLTYEWESSNTDVATVSQSGLLTAKSEGVTTITAKYGDLTSSVVLLISSGKTQDYTSFVFYQNEDVNLPNCVAGYFDNEGNCWKLGDLGDLSKGKYSNEIILEDNSISTVYFFTDYISPRIFNKAFVVVSNKKNIFNLTSDISGKRVEKDNPKEYPQEVDAE